MGNMAPTQIEAVHGQVAHTIHNHHIHHHTVHAHGPVYVNTNMDVDVFALQAPPAPPAQARTRTAKPVVDITPAQKALLALMRPLPRAMRGNILDFMRIEFGTGMVVDLSPSELQRVRRVVLDARRTAGL